MNHLFIQTAKTVQNLYQEAVGVDMEFEDIETLCS